VFCETRSEFCIITVIDERGSVFSSPYLAQRETTALAATDQFLHAIQSRQESLRPIADGHDQARYRTRYFRLAKDARKAAFSITPLAIKQVIGGAHYLRVQAIASRDEQNRTMFSVYIGDRSFHESTLGASFHTEVARHIISLRANALDYPVYINDLDLSALDGDIQPSLQTIHYLRYKYHIESLINEGLKRHASD
jgi:adenylate cyclase class 1